MMGLVEISLIFEAVCALILLVLLAIYIKNMKVMKSKFTLGLAVFAALLFIDTLLTIYDHLEVLQR